MIADPWSVASGYIAVGEPFGDGAVGIGKGSVVEISAYDHRGAAVVGDISRHGIGLRCPFPGLFSKMGDEPFRRARGGSASQFAFHHELEPILLFQD